MLLVSVGNRYLLGVINRYLRHAPCAILAPCSLLLSQQSTCAKLALANPQLAGILNSDAPKAYAQLQGLAAQGNAADTLAAEFDPMSAGERDPNPHLVLT